LLVKTEVFVISRHFRFSVQTSPGCARGPKSAMSLHPASAVDRDQ
jgi:hypothetical protein